MSNRLTRADILSAQDRPVVRVEVPEWGAGKYVLVKAMSGLDRDRYEASLRDDKGKFVQDLWRAKTCAAVIVDENGAPEFTEADLQALGQKNANALDRIVEVANRKNALDGAAVEALVGNSEPAPSDASTSPSPES